MDSSDSLTCELKSLFECLTIQLCYVCGLGLSHFFQSGIIIIIINDLEGDQCNWSLLQGTGLESLAGQTHLSHIKTFVNIDLEKPEIQLPCVRTQHKLMQPLSL